MTYKILLIEDDNNISTFITTILDANGYDPLLARNGKEAMALVSSTCPDLVLLDMGLPDMDGMKILQFIRQWSSLPVIVVSARTRERDKVEALDAGADDYITKPVSMRVLCSRVNAIKRRIEEQKSAPLLASTKLLDEQRAYRSEEGDITLAAKEYEILRLLTSEDRIFTREEIYNTVWGGAVVVGGRTLDVHIRHLRSKIGEDKIVTCKGVGYKFCQ